MCDVERAIKLLNIWLSTSLRLPLTVATEPKISTE